MGLSDTVKDPAIRASMTADCAKLMDEQVAAKSGLAGLAIKATYGVVKGVGPNYVTGAIGRLLPEVLRALEPMWHEGQEMGDPVQHLIHHRARTADTVLSVTDARIHKADGIVRSSYNKLRKSVQGDIEAAVPGLAKIIGKHAKDSAYTA